MSLKLPHLSEYLLATLVSDVFLTVHPYILQVNNDVFRSDDPTSGLSGQKVTYLSRNLFVGMFSDVDEWLDQSRP